MDWVGLRADVYAGMFCISICMHCPYVQDINKDVQGSFSLGEGLFFVLSVSKLFFSASFPSASSKLQDDRY